MSIRLLVIADKPPRESIKKIINITPVDLIITLGDLDYLQISELGEITNIPKIGVYGNHDSGNYMESLGIKNMHLKIETIKGVTFGGFEGSIKYKESEYAKMCTQEESSRLLANFPKVEVLIAHSPPKGIHDHTDSAHIGLQGLLEYVQSKQPKYMLHGHTYISPENKIAMLGDTRIIYVTADEVIDLDINRILL